MKKLFAWLLTCLLAFGLLPAQAVRAVERGETIHIATLEEYYAFAQSCHVDAWSDGMTVYLDADITLPDSGDNSDHMIATFGGSFDGQGHRISGVKISGIASNTGLFGVVQPGAVVKNLSVSGTYKPTGIQTRIGGVAGANYGRIEHCSFDGSVSADSEVGGIVGRNMQSGAVTDCQVRGEVLGMSSCGGIVGYNEGTITNCTSEASVNISYQDAPLTQAQLTDAIENIVMTGKLNTIKILNTRIDNGGIAGYSSGVVQFCSNQGTVGYEHVGSNVGGVVGRSTGFIQYCRNEGPVYGRRDVGGIAGQQQPFLERDYTQGEFAQLNAELDKLDGMIKGTLNDVSGSANATTASLNRIADYTAGAKADIDAMAEGAVDRADEEARRITETTSALQEMSDGLTGDLAGISAYMNGLTGAADALYQAMDTYSDELALSDAERKTMAESKQTIELGRERIDEDIAAIEDGLASMSGYDPASLRSLLTSTSRLLSDVTETTAAATSAAGVMLALADRAVSTKDFAAIHSAMGQLDRALTDDPGTQLSKHLSTLASLNLQVNGVSDDTKNAGSDLQASLDGMLYEARRLTNNLNGGIQGTVADLKRISEQSGKVIEQFEDIMKGLTDPSGYVDTHVQDASAEDIAGTTDGRTTGCTNAGTINGDDYVGGIVGKFGIELDFDPETDVEQVGVATMDYVLREKCVADRCVNTGTIIGNKGYCGGIVGIMEAGLVTDCENYGDISLAENYAGGVAGYSVSAIRDSFSKCGMTGGRYVGGIVGYGNTVENCVAVVTVTGAQQFIGAIAGKVRDMDALSGVANNRYYSESAFGIDGISYANAAEGIAYSELLSIPGLPAGFRLLTVTFLADGEVLASVDCGYGGGLDASGIPNVPEREGFFGTWSLTDFDSITASQTVVAQYSRIQTLLSGEPLRENGLPVVLAEGKFHDGDALTVIAGTDEAGERWTVSIPDDGSATHTVRFLPPEGVDKATLLLPDGTALQTSELGQYLTFETEQSDLTFIVRTSQSHTRRYILCAVGGAAVLAAAALIAIPMRRRKRRRITTMNEGERTAP